MIQISPQMRILIAAEAVDGALHSAQGAGEVLPHVPDAWIDPDATKIGHAISFTRHFYQPKPLRTLEEIRADILAVKNEAEGLLGELVQGASK